MPRDAAAIGKKKQEAGSLFEAWVEAQHDFALCAGWLACVEHNEAHAKTIRGKVMYVAAGIADYTGTINNGHGTTLAVEAKSTADARLMRSIVAPKQARHLEAVAKAGGISLLLVEYRTAHAKQRFAIPWLEVPWQTLRTAESIGPQDVDKWRIPTDKCYLVAHLPPSLTSGELKLQPMVKRVYRRD
jgi:penicillin-binding protein-related factor A (putative recombinase)